MGSAGNAPASGGGHGQIGSETAAAAGDVNNRRLTVDTIQVVAQNCIQR